eukprot:GHUV01057620.1.p1 GENE.GHUV01057620.1~~GHUV01057620.1.p1  ORF type:complete len:151 (-),score=30.51 GHUV01057620.1:349-801(-)
MHRLLGGSGSWLHRHSVHDALEQHQGLAVTGTYFAVPNSEGLTSCFQPTEQTTPSNWDHTQLRGDKHARRLLSRVTFTWHDPVIGTAAQHQQQIQEYHWEPADKNNPNKPASDSPGSCSLPARTSQWSMLYRQYGTEVNAFNFLSTSSLV